MSDFVKGLREYADAAEDDFLNGAADEMERLYKENEKLKAELDKSESLVGPLAPIPEYTGV